MPLPAPTRTQQFGLLLLVTALAVYTSLTAWMG